MSEETSWPLQKGDCLIIIIVIIIIIIIDY
jgi:hypothetical protein